MNNIDPLNSFQYNENKPPKWQYFLGAVIFLILILASLFLVHDKNEKTSLQNNNNITTESNNNKVELSNDSDQDGLSDSEEKKYGTNPSNADSDGDGFGDKEEIEAGYNPLGEGALENQSLAQNKYDYPKSKNDCFDAKNKRYDISCVIILAKSNFDYRLCQELLSNYPYDCYQKVAIENKDIEGCNKQQDSRNKNYCLQLVGSNALDENICRMITDQTNKDLCLKNIATNKNDINGCKIISDPEKQGQCIRLIANKKNDPDLCEQISFFAQKNWCYYDMALEKGLSDYCLQINDIERKDGCFYAVAKKNYDAEQCEKIANNKLSANCLAILYNEHGKTQEQKIEIAQKILEDNFLLIIIYKIAGMIIGALVLSAIFHLVIKKIATNPKEYIYTLGSFLIGGAVFLILDFSATVLGLYLPKIIKFFIFLRLLAYPLMFILYFYLFSKWHKTSIIENIKIFSICILILLAISVIFSIIGYVIYVMLIILFGRGFMF